MAGIAREPEKPTGAEHCGIKPPCKETGLIFTMRNLWGQRGSNPRPTDYESAALTD